MRFENQDETANHVKGKSLNFWERAGCPRDTYEEEAKRLAKRFEKENFFSATLLDAARNGSVAFALKVMREAKEIDESLLNELVDYEEVRESDEIQKTIIAIAKTKGSSEGKRVVLEALFFSWGETKESVWREAREIMSSETMSNIGFEDWPLSEPKDARCIWLDSFEYFMKMKNLDETEVIDEVAKWLNSMDYEQWSAGIEELVKIAVKEKELKKRSYELLSPLERKKWSEKTAKIGEMIYNVLVDCGCEENPKTKTGKRLIREGESPPWLVAQSKARVEKRVIDSIACKKNAEEGKGRKRI